MGNYFSTLMTPNTTDNCDDYTDSEEEDESSPNPNLKNEFTMDLCVDSATDSVLLSPATKTIKLTIENVRQIECSLENYEKVSLIFLLCDDNDCALQSIKRPNESVLFYWAQEQISKKIPKWDEKLVEALCIIQNYQVLKPLSLLKSDLKQRFLPQYGITSVFVNKFRKFLYLICEKLTIEEIDSFINKIEEDCKIKNLPFHRFKSNYLETYFLHLEQIGYITSNNLSNLCNLFKVLDNIELYEMTKSEMERNTPRKSLNIASTSKLETSVVDKILDSSSLVDFVSQQEQTYASTTPKKLRYSIDPVNPGVCLIINQEHFYRETDAAYKNLLPEIGAPLDSRQGTAKDQSVLETTFKRFGYRVITCYNLTHTEMWQKIEETTREITTESSLFVCIMSHGDEGLVYGSNSCKVLVKDIQRIMCESNYRGLKGKPKVLLLQSCQGQQLQTVPKDDINDELQVDGPTKRLANVPSTDLFTFWATVPGFYAIRHKKNGSWFFQSLCQKMLELADEYHFDEICTFVTDDITKKVWGKNGMDVTMVPLKNSTFTKCFYLPSMKTL